MLNDMKNTKENTGRTLNKELKSDITIRVEYLLKEYGPACYKGVFFVDWWLRADSLLGRNHDMSAAPIKDRLHTFNTKYWITVRQVG